MAASGFELPNGFVNHGPMACEALATLGFTEEIHGWARRFSRAGVPAVEPEMPTTFDWRGSLGDYQKLPEWIGTFEVAIVDEGWPQVVQTWVPRLMPGLATVLFHGMIRVAHAVRAVDHVETEPRRRELARSLGYWAARFKPGHPWDTWPEVQDVHGAIRAAAADGAARYVASPSIYYLHGVTGAMAVDLLLPHLAEPDREPALAQLRAEHAAMYAGETPVTDIQAAGISEEDLARAADASGDPHQVKLVEACARGLRATGAPAFAVAAETVTSLG